MIGCVEDSSTDIYEAGRAAGIDPVIALREE
jgi:hypothetical protein